MPDTTVKYFDSTMSGAPALSGTEGTLIGVLDACLVNGFGSVTLDSLVVASNIATATVSAGHQFAMIGNTGPVIRIAGASPAGLNGDWRVTVTSSTAFTFATSGISDQTASGTITAKRAPAGFSKAFTGTNKAAYRADSVQSTRLFCRVDDSTTYYGRVRGYEAMSDVDTGTGLFPTDAQISGGGYVYKTDSPNQPWTLYSDGRMVYVFINASTGHWAGGFVFGDIVSYVASDPFGCVLMTAGSAVGSCSLSELVGTTNSYLARASTQLGSCILSARYSHAKTTTRMGVGGQSYPAPADNGIHLWPVECWDVAAHARGLMPGLWNPIHNSSTTHGLVIEAIPQLPGRTLLIQTTGNSAYRCALDITGPWR